MFADISIRMAVHLLKNGIRFDRVSRSSRRRLERLFGTLLFERRKEICSEVIRVNGRIVTSGPFEGMKVSERISWGDGDILPKLIGSYEAELAPLFDELKDVHFDLVINVGAAEGFYAVGSALSLKADRVIAVDIDQEALEATRENAELNGVGDKVEGRLGLDAEGLRNLALKADRCFVISDCEGFELDLFSSAAVDALKYSICLIECHDFIGQAVADILEERFAATHDVEIVEEGSRNPNQYSVLRTRGSLDRWLAVSEGRPQTMHWLVARPKVGFS